MQAGLWQPEVIGLFLGMIGLFLGMLALQLLQGIAKGALAARG